MMSVFSVQATVLKNSYSQKLVDMKEMFVQQVSLFHLAKGCVRLEGYFSNLS